MLTGNEREWLEHRDAMQFLTGTYIADFAEFPLQNNSKDWQDAAEFSERVAVKLAYYASRLAGTQPCDIACPVSVCPFDAGDCDDCAPDILRAARLEVEEEMDADRK